MVKYAREPDSAAKVSEEHERKGRNDAKHAMQETKESDPKRKRKGTNEKGKEKGFRPPPESVHANHKEKEHEDRPYEEKDARMHQTHAR